MSRTIKCLIMRRLFLLLVCLMLTFVSFAQTEHLKFMGIPLDGTIVDFNAKLLAKGLKYDAFFNNTLPTGVLAYNGVFAGEDAHIFVYYNTNTKIVYRAKATITCLNENTAKSLEKEIWTMITVKYPNGEEHQIEHEGFPAHCTLLSNSNNTYLGSISLYMSRSQYNKLEGEVTLHVDYEDGPNGINNKIENMDDL